jgi:hypothetical protein
MTVEVVAMSDVFAKCGARCTVCPGFRENVRCVEDKQRCSEGWAKYLNAKLKAERCYCDGCHTPDDQNPLLILGRSGCRVRRCATHNNVPTCAHCTAYPCEALQAQLFEPGSREQVAERLGQSVSEEDYLTFLEPYDMKAHLEETRASLAPEDIVAPLKPPAHTFKTVGFPHELPLAAGELLGLQAVHRLLSTLNVVDAESLAMKELLEERRKDLLKVLWTFGVAGEWQEPDGQLVIDDRDWRAQKLPSQHTRVKRLWDILSGHGVECTFKPLGEGWLLRSGWIRHRSQRWDVGWQMMLSLDQPAGGEAALLALSSYAQALEGQLGSKAYRKFAQADMRPLL